MATQAQIAVSGSPGEDGIRSGCAPDQAISGERFSATWSWRSSP